MGSDGLNLGQIPFSASHRPVRSKHRPKRAAASSDAVLVRTGQLNAAVGPMFKLAAGQLERPLSARSSVPTTLFSSAAHAVVFVGIFLLISMSERIALPTPHETTHMVAMLIAAPPPPPPPAPAAAAPAAAAAAPATPPRSEPPPRMFDAPPPDLSLSLTELPEEAPPAPYFAPPPSLTVGFGAGGAGSVDGTGSGFGVEGGVGWGQGTSSPGIEAVRVGAGVESHELVHRVEPVYPPDAVAKRVESTVVVEATVDEQGHVQEVRVLRSIGSLDQAAIDAVMQWRYSPLRVNDQVARFILTVNVSFRLH